MDEIKIGIGVSSIGRFLPLVGKAAGLFAKENISVEVVNQQDEEKVVTDIVTQATPVGTPNAPSLIFSLLEGNDLVIVGGILNRPAFYLAANATIGGIADLKGKRVGINQPRRMAGMVMLALLRKWSLDTSDLTLVDLGINDRSLEALTSRGDRRRAFAAGKSISGGDGRLSRGSGQPRLSTVIGCRSPRLADFSPPIESWSRKSLPSM